ncbi:hypothetical protein CHH83_16280 [Bacillus sp. 7586-K]|nr:hypothetical protein CHH83_16280 [Bacillus sp. 7586-K]
MSREISNDCNQLIDFLKEYNFETHLSNNKFRAQLTSMHKKVFGFLTFIAEVDFQNAQVQFFNEKSLNYFKESGSDLIQALFCWVNGTYKPAEMLLRSSIETFLKAVLGNNDEEIFIEKSMYQILEMAKIHHFFKGDSKKEEHYSILHSNYKLLCMTTHTASIDEFISVNTLKLLPRFNPKTSEQFSKLFISTVNMFLGTILINFHKEIYKMHPMNRTNFFNSIPTNLKREIMGSN